MKKLFVLTLLLFLTVGCTAQYESKGRYFNGDVVVEYLQQAAAGTKDYVTFKFYKKGEYKINFSVTKRGRGTDKLPENFTLLVENTPREYIVTQKILPDFITVTIENNGITESNDFK